MLYLSLWVQTPGSCINSQWQWEEWLSSRRVKAEEKALSFVIHHPPCRSLHRAEIMEWGFPSSALRHVSLSLPLSWQASTPSTTQTVCSPTCTTVSTASQENWLTHSSRQLARSTLMTTNTGFWETCDLAGRKACVFIMFVETGNS